MPRKCTCEQKIKTEKNTILGTYENVVQFWPFKSPKLEICYEFRRKDFKKIKIFHAIPHTKSLWNLD